MKCPHSYLYSDDNEFSEWRKECKECVHFKECTMNYYDQLSTEEFYNSVGDNFPEYNEIHWKLQLHRNRKQMVLDLLKADDLKINQDDIEDELFEIDKYNAQFKKKRKK